jgi:hypothetical protein
VSSMKQGCLQHPLLSSLAALNARGLRGEVCNDIQTADRTGQVADHRSTAGWMAIEEEELDDYFDSDWTN